MSKMGSYQVGRKWLSENRIIPIVETPESVADKAVEKVVGTREVFLTGETIKNSELKKLFVPEAALQPDDEANLKKAKGKIFAVVLQPSRGKFFYDIAVVGNKAQAQKMSKLFLSKVSAALEGVSLGEEKVKKSSGQDSASSEIATSSDHNFLTDSWFIESEIPFTVE